MKFIAGQTLFFEPDSSVCSSTKRGLVDVKKVGRKWLHLSNGVRVSAQTLKADGNGYASPGRCYLTEEERNAFFALKKEWTFFICRVNSGMPQGVTLEKIDRARQLLGI